MSKPTIAIAQTVPVSGDVSQNIKAHLKMIAIAGKAGADIILFPELSLTGYEPTLAHQLAFSFGDDRLEPLRNISKKLNMIIIVGAPFKDENGLQISSFIIYPNKPPAIYSKHYLHAGEEHYFVPGTFNETIKYNDEIISLAICADIAVPAHAKDASLMGCTIYLASVFITPGGYETDAAILRNFAKTYSMTVMKSNYGGPSGGFNTGGKSAVWDQDGSLLTACVAAGEGLAIAKKKDGAWNAEVLFSG